LVEPIAEDLDEEAPDSDAEEGTPISEEACGKPYKFERFPGPSHTRNKPIYQDYDQRFTNDYRGVIINPD
jgi:hypothetical protein